MLKSPNTNTLADGLIERASSMLDEIESKTLCKDEEVIDRGKTKKDTECSKASQKHK